MTLSTDTSSLSMTMSTGSSDVTTELEHLILSCYVNDSDEELNSGPVKDIGRHISVEARAYFSSLGMSSCSDDKSKVDLSLKYIALLMQRLGSGSLVARTLRCDSPTLGCPPRRA